MLENLPTQIGAATQILGTAMSTTLLQKFLRDAGIDVFNGNELLFKGVLETEGGVHLITGYPGSPVSAVFDVLSDCADLLKEHGIEGRLANNEALAVAAVNGSQMGPLRAMVLMKSVGLHVAADALALGNLCGPHPEGGAIVVVGDDPWSESTQVPADSRFLFRHLFVPIIEPSTPQEVKDFVGASFQLSRASGLYMGYIITTTLAEGGGSVTLGPNHYPLTNTNHPYELRTDTLDLQNKVLLPPRTGRRELDIPERFERLGREAERLGVNHLYDVKGNDELLIVTSGLAYQYVRQSLTDMALIDGTPLLKLGITYPLDLRTMEPLLARFKHVLVIEERRAFIEDQLAAMLVRLGQNPGQNGPRRLSAVWGKQFPKGTTGVPSGLGLNVAIVGDRIARFLKSIDSPLARRASARIESELRVVAETAKLPVNIPARTPTFCPGCPHRDSASLLLQLKDDFADEQYMRRRHGCGAVDLVFHGDTGCYTMLLFEPTTPLMHNYSGMGLGGGTGSGIDPFIRNKQVVFMGDSTFFHSGSIAISNSVSGRQDITYIILANGTTAMTGHQPLPTLETDLLGRPIPSQDIERIVGAITGGLCPVIRTNPTEHSYREALEQTILTDGVKIIIADKECGITAQRRRLALERAEQRRLGFLRKKVYMNVTPEVCEFCLECASTTGCPGLTIEDTDYGHKIQTDMSWCVNDGACARLGVCPSFEEVIIKRRRPPTPRGHKIALEDIPEPTPEFNGQIWRAWLAGVGGMGIGTATSILVYAGKHEGYQVQFSDKKGLAIRNGGTYSQLIYCKTPDTGASMTVSYGKADLLLGLDPLEAVRAVDPKTTFRVASPERTAAVVNTDPTPTIRMLIGNDSFRVDDLERTLRKAVRPDRFFTGRISSLCERIFGTKLYMNITMLGIAYQNGLIPVSLEAMKEGIRKTIRADFKRNLRAFDLGRKLVSHPELFTEGEIPVSLARTVREKAAYLNMRLLGKSRALRNEIPGAAGKRRLPDTKLARSYKHMVLTTLRACRELDRGTMRDIAVRIYDLMQWGGVRYAQRYIQRVRRVFLADHERFGFAATRAVVWNLAKLMLVKDEFYVAHLLTSYEKLRRDRQRYNVNFSNGDRIRYRRTFHPRFLGKQVDLRIPHWSLYVLRNFRFLRSIMPWWHHEDKKLLRWYEGLIDDFAFRDAAAYQAYVQALSAVEPVTGYAEVRWPKMQTAMSKAKQILASIKRTDTRKQPV
jgi:indolepyruvate ferredoxin oxidoreductase